MIGHFVTPQPVQVQLLPAFVYGFIISYNQPHLVTRHFVTPHLFKCSFCLLAFNRTTTLEDHVNAVHDLVRDFQPELLTRRVPLPKECRSARLIFVSSKIGMYRNAESRVGTGTSFVAGN